MMTPSTPTNFSLSNTAKAKVLSILNNMKQFDSSTEWIAAIVWSTALDENARVIEGSPGIAIYAAHDVLSTQIVEISGVRVVFPGADQSHFVRKTLDFDVAKNRFVLG